MFGWMKQYLPRGIFGRAALILLLPVIGVQFVVSVVFIQRHFEGVTAQMTRSVVVDLAYLGRGADGGLALASELGFEARVPDVIATGADGRAFYDLSGRVVIRELRAALPGVRRVDLCDRQGACGLQEVAVTLDTGAGPRELRFDRDRVSASNPHQLLVIMVVLGAVMTGVSFLYLRNQLRPITRLARVAQEYGRGRVLPYRLAGASEVRAAGAAFLDMRARIERQSQARRLMLSGISHDLRTPLTRMRLELSMMDEAAAAPLIRDVEDMQRLVDAFLDYARNDAEDSVERTDLPDLIAQAVDDARRAGGDVHIGTCATLTERPRMRPMALRRALDNLIGNGVRYGTRVEVSLDATPKVLTIRVEDDGPGITMDQRQDAIRPFTRLDSARNQDLGAGVGLGLAIVADIARSHGGRLVLEDSRLGGLRAALVLPR